jgi:carbonic anhydrase
MTPAAALERLDIGNHRFVDGKREHTYRERERRVALVERQSPFAVVVGCADSRVPPELVYDQGLGDIYTVRVAGNTVNDPLVMGSIELALLAVEPVAIVVLGHEGCAAVATAIAAADGRQLDGDVPAVVEPILPVVESVTDVADDARLRAVIDANVRRSVAQLQASDIVSEAIRRDALAVVGRVYELHSGRVVPVS